MVAIQESIYSRFCSVVEIKLSIFPQGWPLTEVRLYHNITNYYCMRDGDLLLCLLSSYQYTNEPRGFVVPVNLTRG